MAVVIPPTIRGLIASTLAALLLVLAGGVGTEAHAASASPRAEVLAAVQQARAAHGLPPLDHMADLAGVAADWSAHMARIGRLEHRSDVTAGVCCWRGIGEILVRIPEPDPGNGGRWAVDLWLGSTGHRDILLGSFDQIGLGVVVDGEGRWWITGVLRHWDGTRANEMRFTEQAPGFTDRDTATNPFDGDPETPERFSGGAIAHKAVEMSRARFSKHAATHAVLTRDDLFADGLAAAPLTVDGPLLLVGRSGLTQETIDEIDRALAPSSAVYVLGGQSAISDADLAGLGRDIIRFGGADRIETSLMIANEVRRRYGDTRKVAVARQRGNGSAAWADSVAGGAWAARERTPVLLTHSTRLDPRVARWLELDAPWETVVFGGEAAISSSVEAQLPNPTRIAGRDRVETSLRVAERLGAASADTAVFVDAFASNPWTGGLLAVGLAADALTPMVLVRDGQLDDAVVDVFDACGNARVDVLVLAPRDRVPDGVVYQLHDTC